VSDRVLRRVAYVLWVAFLALFPMTFALGAADDSVFLVALFASSTVGTLIVSRHPRNAVGWLLIALALTLATSIFAEGYSESEKTPPFPPGATLASWFSTWAWSAWLVIAAVFLPLVFPDGRPPRRWRWVLWLGVFALVAGSAEAALKAGPLDAEVKPPIQNPLGVGGAAGDVLTTLGSLGSIALVPAIVGAGAALLLRLRRSHGEERQQVKWFVYMCALMLGGFGLAALADPFQDQAVGEIVGGAGWFTALITLAFGLPAAAGIAVFKYRLYDIDVVIRRTLVYAGLTAILAGAYLGSVLVLQLALDPVTSGSSLAVAVSTLAVAALFRPARARIQAVVDRRFYRRRYDAAATLEQFGVRVRQQVDLDALGGELRTVVADTMQPAHVSLWLREAGR
jgi:MFS family permease